MGSDKRINENLLGDFALDMFGGDQATLHDDSLRVEYILLDLVRPDPVQPRRVLPEHIYWAFHSQQVTPSQALREPNQEAQLAARQQGRPFSSVLALLGAEHGELPHFSPEEQPVRDLLNLTLVTRCRTRHSEQISIKSFLSIEVCLMQLHFEIVEPYLSEY